MKLRKWLQYVIVYSIHLTSYDMEGSKYPGLDEEARRKLYAELGIPLSASPRGAVGTAQTSYSDVLKGVMPRDAEEQKVRKPLPTLTEILRQQQVDRLLLELANSVPRGDRESLLVQLLDVAEFSRTKLKAIRFRVDRRGFGGEFTLMHWVAGTQHRKPEDTQLIIEDLRGVFGQSEVPQNDPLDKTRPLSGDLDFCAHNLPKQAALNKALEAGKVVFREVSPADVLTCLAEGRYEIMAIHNLKVNLALRSIEKDSDFVHSEGQYKSGGSFDRVYIAFPKGDDAAFALLSPLAN